MRTLLIISCIIVLFWIALRFDIVPPIYWSFKSFANPYYTENLEKEWSQKPSSFLLVKLHSIDPTRFGLAAYILGERKENRAINILIRKILSSFTSDQMHLSASSALAQISPEKAKEVLMSAVEKYPRSLYKPVAHKKYINALHILASMKDERVYPICLQLAKSGNRLDEQSSLNGMLYNFDNHWKEVLPLYLNYLNEKKGSQMSAITGIKYMKRPETIPILEDFALKNPIYKREVQEAIDYIKESQK